MRAPLLALLLLAACGAGGEEAPPEPPPPLQFERASADTVAHGERLGRVLGCRGCHGDDLTGHEWIDEPEVAVLFTSNLTRLGASYDDAALVRAIRFGDRPGGSPLWAMPSEIFTHLSRPDMAALIAWLRTVPPNGEPHPRLVLGPRGREMIARSEIRPAPAMVRAANGTGPPPLAEGDAFARYMIRATCSECHGLDLAGSPGDGESAGRPDLAIVSAYTRDQFRHLLRTGEPVGGRRLELMAQVSRGRFAHLTGREVDAIYDYLAARAARPQ